MVLNNQCNKKITHHFNQRRILPLQSSNKLSQFRRSQNSDGWVESVLVGLVVDPIGLAVGCLVLEAARDLECLILGAGVRQHGRFLLFMAVALLVAVMVAVNPDVVVLLLLEYRYAGVRTRRSGSGTTELGCCQTRRKHRRQKDQDLPTEIRFEHQNT